MVQSCYYYDIIIKVALLYYKICGQILHTIILRSSYNYISFTVLRQLLISVLVISRQCGYEKKHCIVSNNRTYALTVQNLCFLLSLETAHCVVMGDE